MTTRKDFIAAGAALGAFAPQLTLADAAATPAPAATASATPAPIPKLNFDLAAFDAILARDVAHRHMFSARGIHDGAVFDAMRTLLWSYASIGVDSKDVFPVAVLYHTPVFAGMNDAIWNELIIPNVTKFGKPVGEELGSPKAGSGNPYLHRAKKADEWDGSIEGLVADAQAHFFLCNVAVSGVSQALAGYTKSNAADVYRHIAANLVPNATLAPSGTWSIHAIQERHFTLLETSL